MKIFSRVAPLLFAMLFACAGNPARDTMGMHGHGKGRDTYSYSATSPTDGSFEYAQVSRDDLFDFKTLRLKFQTKVNEGNDGLVFVVDVNIANSGSRAFSWEDYTPFLGIQDQNGDWSYRMLFTQSSVRSIEPRKPVNIRYHAALRGARLPRQYVVVLQSMFGSKDVGFAFAGPTRLQN